MLWCWPTCLYVQHIPLSSGIRQLKALSYVAVVAVWAVVACQSELKLVFAVAELNMVPVVVQIPKTGKGKKGSRPVNKDRFISKMFLR